MFKPMLAVNTKQDKVKYPVLVSNKLEGVRAEFTPSGLLARSMKPFGNQIGLSQIFDTLEQYCIIEDIYIEGEFYIHGMEFNEISSICRRSMHEDTDSIEFHIFDVFTGDNKEFSDRYTDSLSIIANLRMLGQKNIHLINQEFMFNWDSVFAKYCSALELGYEGVVLKDPYGRYKFGRSTLNEGLFTRLKPEGQWDGKIIEIVEMMENLVESIPNELGYLSKIQDKDMKEGKGMAAVAVVECQDFDEPIRVTLSRGLTDADRAEIWLNRESYIGRHIRWVGIPVKGMLPRSPRFDVWRTDLD